MAVLTPQQQQEHMKRFFNPNNDAIPAPPDAQPAPAPAPNVQPVSAAAAPQAAPNVQPPAATSAPGENNYLFKPTPVSPEAFMDPRPVSALDNVHGVKRGLALALGGLASFGAGLQGRQDSTLSNWTNQELAQRQYDANAPRLRARAQVESDKANIENAGAAAGVAHTQAETKNLENNNPATARKAQFMSQLQQEAESGKYDPASLKGRALRMARAGNVVVDPAEIDDVLENTKALGPKYQISQDKNGRPEFATDRQGNRVLPDNQGKFQDPELQAQWDAIGKAHQQSIQEEMNTEGRKADISARAQGRVFAEQDQRQQNQFNQQNEERRREAVTKDELALNSENQQYATATGLLKQAMDPKTPNSAAAQAALFKAIGVDLPEGVHRMTDTELNRVGNLGSAGQKLAGMLKNWSTGVPFTNDIGQQMQSVIDEVHKNKVSEHQQNVDTINRNYGHTPAANSAPTPTTHKFSLSAWQKANPGGDVKAAQAAARAQNYEVIP